MKHTRLPCCFFPTTIVIVDDDEHFCEALQQVLSMEAGIIAKTFIEPKKALAFINGQNSLDLDQCYTVSVDTADENSVYETKTDLSGIMKQVLNPRRKNSVTLIISDYHMPQMDGVTLCKSIESSQIKKILLTSVADDNIAVSAFNAGIIDQFVLKNSGLGEVLSKLVVELQFNLFSAQSAQAYTLYNNAIQEKPFLQQSTFIDWFKQLLTDHHICEFYLVTEFGMLDFMMIRQDEDKRTVYWLSIRDDQDMFALYDVAQSHEDASPEMLNQLKAKKVIPVVTNDHDSHCPPDQWQRILHPAKQITCEGHSIYYALVSDVKNTPIPLK